MPSLRHLVEDIIHDLARLQRTPSEVVDRNDEVPFPRMIGVGDGSTLIVSKTIDRLIAEVAIHLMDSQPSLTVRFTAAEFRTSVRRAMGRALARLDLADDVSRNADTVLAEVRKKILFEAIPSDDPREHCFGCTLFDGSDVPGFEIGPVRFEPRAEWLDRRASEHAISEVTRRRMARIWQGGKVARRKPSREKIEEMEIVDMVGTCRYVCSVTTRGLGPEAGRDKAVTAARLGLTAIALLWQTPSKALEGFNLSIDGPVHRRIIVSFEGGRVVGARSELSHLPYGPSLKPDEWKREFAARKSLFETAGDVLHYFVSPPSRVERPRLMNTMAQALLWFHEGCREAVALIAIVKFAASMDALAEGRKTDGIRRLIHARLRLGEQRMNHDGPTVKELVEEIYKDGRSRTIHGTNDKFGYDWTATRGIAEWFARACLVSCLNWAATNPSSDDPGQMRQ